MWCGDFHGVVDFSGAAAVSGLRRASHSSEGHGVRCRRRYRIQQRRRSEVVRSRFPWIPPAFLSRAQGLDRAPLVGAGVSPETPGAGREKSLLSLRLQTTGGKL
ncbi:hypothetical protein NDU88_008063 [Pleurodeles waltl]|uniref:Uncharacterized protein n=1 Tax=Pleurodeles waltl TaxID=8319 RepID=A0AAV7PQT3_PLEWA|nr:hypothetical protein NDU88_008063 [Pleurodeles waltl]